MFRNLLGFLAAATLLSGPIRGQTLNDLFDDTVLQEIHVQIAPADWQALHDRYLENTYYSCEFTWRGIHLTDVGVRSRGGSTRNPIKPNLGFDFSRYKSSQRFLSLKSLVTRNFAQDSSMKREFLSMKLFGRLGLHHLRESYAKIYVNGEYSGIFLLVEPIDKRFLLSRFGEDTGYLYEGKYPGFPYNFDYLGEDPSQYIPNVFEPKTHEDKPDAERLIAMIRAANQASDAELVSVLSEYMDVDQFVAHLAVEQFLAEDDGLLGYGGMTNYYLYRRTSDNRFVLLPWDKDNALSDPMRSIWHNSAGNILYRRLLNQPALRQRFLHTIDHALETIGGAYGWMYFENERVHELIREAALSDPFRVCAEEGITAPCPASRFEVSHGYLKSFPNTRTTFVSGELLQGGLESDPTGPRLWAGSVTNLPTGHAFVAPGSLARVRMETALYDAEWATSTPLPLELQGLRVRIGGVNAPMWMASPSEIYFQVPWELACGVQTVEVSLNGHIDHIVDIEVRPAVIGVLSATHGDWTPISAQSPARQAEWITLWGTGFAYSNVQQKTGVPSPNAVIATTQKITATVDGLPAAIRFAGMAPGQVGVTQVVIELPAGLSGGLLPVRITVNDEPGDPYLLEVTR